MFPVERTVPSFGYEYYPGFGFYRFHSIPQTWDNARLMCEMEGGHLAIVNSIFEHGIIQKYFARPLPEHPDEIDLITIAFIGFHDLFEEGHHITLFSEYNYICSVLIPLVKIKWYSNNLKSEKNCRGTEISM